MPDPHVLIYDSEIVNLIPDRYNQLDPRYTYCAGWNDYANMGIACVAVYSSKYGYDVFLANQLLQLQALVNEADEIVGFNSTGFDDNLLSANGVNVRTTYDLLREVRVAAGMPPHYVRGVTRQGYDLDSLARANLGRGKSGYGELAPRQWQDGLARAVLDYCLDDVVLLRQLWEKRGALIDPTNGSLLYCRGGKPADYRRALQAQRKAASLRSDWRAFRWAIAKGDIRQCRIYLPLSISRNRHIHNRLSVSIELSAPSLYVPYSVKSRFLDYADPTRVDDVPF